MEESELNPTPILCEQHYPTPGPYAGLPNSHNKPAFYCVSCTVERVAKLVETMKPAAVFRLMYVEPQHVPAIVRAMQIFTIALKKSNPERSLVRNRVPSLSRYLWEYFAGLGHSKQERFRRYNVPDADWRPRRIGIPCEIEKKSLSSYSDVVAYNRTVTA